MKKFIRFLVCAAFAFGSFFFCFLGFYNFMASKDFYHLGFFGVLFPLVFSLVVGVFSYEGLNLIVTPKKKDKEDENT